MTDSKLSVRAISPLLELIDEELAWSQVPLANRPQHATLALIRDFTEGITFGDELQPLPKTTAAILAAPWSASVFVVVHEWYTQRYGPTLNVRDQHLYGLVLLYGTPFSIRVPSTRSRPEDPGQTSWLSFPCELGTDEDPYDWIASAPNTTDLPPWDRAAVLEVATLLRSINVKLLGTEQVDPTATAFLRGIPIHLRAAADLVVRRWRDGGNCQAFWELQMSCECAFKSLLQSKHGKYLATHDLIKLHKSATTVGVTTPLELIRALPKWRRMINLRYGQGHEPSLSYYFDAYRTTLRIVDTVLSPGVSMNLVGASLKLCPHPWYQALWAAEDAKAIG